MKIAAFDFETYLIEPANQFPRAVCMSWATSRSCAGVVLAQDGIRLLNAWLDAGCSIVGANTAFDVLVSVFNAPDGQALLEKWTKAYDEDRVHDVLIRQKMIDLAAGMLRYDPESGKRNNYGLADVARRLTGAELDKENYWRLHYSELDGVPIAEYPADAYDYSLGDSVETFGCYIAQEVERKTNRRAQRNFPGLDPLRNEFEQTRAALSLSAMSGYGLRTEPVAVERLAVAAELEHVRIRQELLRPVDALGIGEPLIRTSVTRNREGILAHLEQRGLVAALTGRDGKVHLAAKKIATFVKGPSDPLVAVCDWKTAIADTKMVELLGALGLANVKHSRDTKAAARRQVAAYLRLGRAVPRTKKYDAAVHGDDERIALDAESCEASEDPIMQFYADYTGVSKTISSDIPMLREGAKQPIHTHYEVLLETGRTSSSKPNVQNIRRLPGIRECFVPRPGFVFVAADYSALELHTLGQICLWVLGWSRLADALRATPKRDPHSEMAATILGIPYAEVLERLSEDAVFNARQTGKGVNFGAPGGLGKKSFPAYAYRAYGVRLTEAEAARLIKQYKETWLEMPAYFAYIESLSAGGTHGRDDKARHNIPQPWSGRLRAGATYCAACNTGFQGLGADVAKVALWWVFKACYVNKSDPLFGCKPVNFVHDDIQLEAPIARAHEAAIRLSEIMVAASAYVMPDVPIRADPVVMVQWSKKAKPIYNAAGRLIPWEIHKACELELAKHRQKTGADIAAGADYLRGEHWPHDVIEKTILKAAAC